MARRIGKLLIVDPDPLTQWSLQKYLERWFDVATTGSAEGANRLLAEQPVQALIISDELPQDSAEFIEQYAQRRNPDVAVVRTVTSVLDGAKLPAGTIRLEKPFELAGLARLLGIADQETR